MVNNPDVRWQQRFANYKKALAQLKDAVALGRQQQLNQLEKLGIIQTCTTDETKAENLAKV